MTTTDQQHNSSHPKTNLEVMTTTEKEHTNSHAAFNTATTMQSPGRPLARPKSFMDLPAEIRLMVYEHALLRPGGVSPYELNR
jgi:hypothetical protein